MLILVQRILEGTVMFRHNNLISIVTVCAGMGLAGCNFQGTDINPVPPMARRQPHEMVAHGHTRQDPYYWLRDDDRTDTEVLAYLKAENEYADRVLKHTLPLQEKIFNEIIGRIQKDDTSVPVRDNGYYYSRLYEGDKEYAIHVRKKDQANSEQEILLDGNKLAEGQKYFDLGSYSVSLDNRKMAYSTDFDGRGIYTIQIVDLVTGKTHPDKLENTTGSLVWANDNKTLFYIVKDPVTLLGYKVCRHQLGTDQSRDITVYEEKDKTLFVGIGKTKDKSEIIIYHSNHTSCAASVIDASAPHQKPVLFHAIEEGLEYYFEKKGNWYYIVTNLEAPNFRIMKVHRDKTSDKRNWQPLLKYDPSAYIEEFELMKDYLVLNEKVRGQTRIRSMRLETKEITHLLFDEPVFMAGFSSNPDSESNVLRFYYTSMTTPTTTYEQDLTSGKRVVLKQRKIPGGFTPSEYGSERIFIKARDGVEVPVSIVYRKDKFNRDGTNPLYLYGYGAYGSTIDPYFSTNRLSLLDRGFVFAIAHIRGGQMLGRSWYDDGKLMNKKNTFTDFIDVTEGLVKAGYAATDKIFASGGSAGGLLIGAVINMRPDLYKAVVADVPFVDVLTTMSDPSLPLTTNEYGEWGNPADPKAYKYMLSYSPYDQVRRMDYPHILVNTGLHDAMVQYFEPAKWVAKLRAMKTDQNLLILRTNMDAGHGGASGRFRANRDMAIEYALFCGLAGIKN